MPLKIEVGDTVYVEKMNYWKGEVLEINGPLYHCRADSPDAEILFIWATREALCCVKPVPDYYKEHEVAVQGAESTRRVLRLTWCPPTGEKK